MKTAYYTHTDSIVINGFTYKDVDITLDLARTYEDGSPIIELISNVDGPLATATVCLAGYRIAPPDDGHVYIKDYSENSGMSQALAALGLIEVQTNIHVGPFAAEVKDARLLLENWDG